MIAYCQRWLKDTESKRLGDLYVGVTHTIISSAVQTKICNLWFRLGWARFAKNFFSLISEIKRIWIRFTCVSLFHYKISLLFFRFFLLRSTLVIFALKWNKAKRNSSLFLRFFHFFHFFSLFFAFFSLFLHFFCIFSLFSLKFFRFASI